MYEDMNEDVFTVEAVKKNPEKAIKAYIEWYDGHSGEWTESRMAVRAAVEIVLRLTSKKKAAKKPAKKVAKKSKKK